MLIGAREQIAFVIEKEPVGPAAGLEKGGEFALHTPFHDPVIRLIGKKYVSLRIGGWSFGELEIAGQFFHPCSGGDDAAFCPRNLESYRERAPDHCHG